MTDEKDKKKKVMIGGQFQMVDLDTIPQAHRGKTLEKWIELFKDIPTGKAMVIPDGEGFHFSTIKQAVLKLQKEEKLPETLRVSQRTDSETEAKTTYVLNEEETE